jgi:hypothetical protein
MLMQAEEGERSGVEVWVPDAEFNARQSAMEGAGGEDQYGEAEEEAEAAGMDQFDYYCEELAEDSRDEWRQEDGDDDFFHFEEDDDDDLDDAYEDRNVRDDSGSDDEDDIDIADYEFDDSDDDRDKDGSYLSARRTLRAVPDSISEEKEDLRKAVESMSPAELQALLRGR